MKICIYGGGSIGGYIAAHLARDNKAEVSVIARGGTLAAIRARGIRVKKPDEDFTVGVNATDDPAELGVQDYVFLTLKVHQLDAILEPLRSLVGSETAILPPNAGLPYYFTHKLPSRHADRPLPRIDPGGRQAAVMPPSQVIGCPYWIGVHSPAPGVVHRDGARALLPLGELDGTASRRVTTLRDLLESSGIQSSVSDNIHGEVWVKFVNALCWNPSAILTGAPNGQLGGSDVGGVIRTMMEEADAMGCELGVRIPMSPGERVANTSKGTYHKMSMLQDFEKGRPTELEALFDSLRSLTDLTGLSAPTLEAVYALARLRSAVAQA